MRRLRILLCSACAWFVEISLANASAELGNLSARLRVAAGGAPAIAGAVLSGPGTQTLLVRAVGPGLGGFGVEGVLADPRLTVFDAAGRVIATNDNWESDGGGVAVREAAGAAGAFALAAGSKDAAAVVRAYGLFRTSDTGKTWEARNPAGLVIENFDAFAQDNAILYANDNSGKRIHKSLDGGRTWTRTALGNFGPIRIAPDNANTILYTGFTSLMKSSDGAATMRVVLDDTAYLNGRQFMDIKYPASDPRVVWAAAKGYLLYKSTDGGERFTRVPAVRDMIYGVGN